ENDNGTIDCKLLPEDGEYEYIKDLFPIVFDYIPVPARVMALLQHQQQLPQQHQQNQQQQEPNQRLPTPPGTPPINLCK
ncbi:hypothetical protein HDU76_011327, partial [Blyttiomyces sp. JEL0837]